MADKRIFAIIAIAVIGILALAYFSGAGVGGASGGTSNGEVINCEVRVKNPTIGNAKLDPPPSCVRDNCGLFDTLSIFGAEGNIRMIVGGKVVATTGYDFNALSTTTKVYDLKSSCISKGQTATIELIKDDGKLLESRSGL